MPVFFVRNTADTTDDGIFSPEFDFQVDFNAINQFLNTYNSTRLNFYGDSLAFDMENDYAMSDLFNLPCYGQTFFQNYNSIMQLVQNEWNIYLQENNVNMVAGTLDVIKFPSLTLPYVNYKGFLLFLLILLYSYMLLFFSHNYKY